MKKIVCGALSLALAACCLTACGNKNETGQGTNPEVDAASAVTDFEVGDVEIHESILPWQFDENEAVENPYYKRTTDENGANVYAVLKASDNQVAYLPMSNTVVYMGDSGDCYFERTTNTYKLDGDGQTVVQYQLYVSSGAAAGDDVAISDVTGPEVAGPEVDADADALEGPVSSSLAKENGDLGGEAGDDVMLADLTAE